MSAIVINKAAKKEQILLSAIELFASKGFAKTTINEIALSAGIGKGTVYEYFKSKDDIIHNSFNYFTQRIFKEFEEILSMNLNAKGKFLQVLRIMGKITEGDTAELFEIMMDFWAEGLRSDTAKGILKQDMKKMYEDYRVVLKEIVSEGIAAGDFKSSIDAESVSTSTIAVIDGLMVQWILDKERVNISKIIEDFSKIILKGIETEEK